MKALLAAVVLFLGATACGRGERPFRMVQFCLANPEDIEAMKAVLRGVASANKLPFYDRSRETEAEAESLAEGQANRSVAHPAVNAGAIGLDGIGFGAANFDEAPLQIVIGFSNGHDPTAVHKLSDAVVEALSQRWRIHEVPHVDTTGASPLKDCDS